MVDVDPLDQVWRALSSRAPRSAFRTSYSPQSSFWRLLGSQDWKSSLVLTELDGKTLPFARRFQSALLRFQPRHTEEVVAPCEKEAPELAELRRKTSEAPESWGEMACSGSRTDVREPKTRVNHGIS